MNITIENSRLQGEIGGKPVAQVETPNKGGDLKPQWLVVHYTGSSAEGATSVFENIKTQASAHLLIYRDGSVTQFVPFNLRALHVGKSQQDSLQHLDWHSIGVEIENRGRLVQMRHRNSSGPCTHWQGYTPAQLDTCRELASLLVATYGLKEILGHDDIAPERKQDPGPAFLIEHLRTAVFPATAQPPAKAFEAPHWAAVASAAADPEAADDQRAKPMSAIARAVASNEPMRSAAAR